MRRLIAFCALVSLALPASALAHTSSGDGTLVVHNGTSDDLTTPVVRMVAFHGAVFGQIDSGRIVIADLTPNDPYKPIVPSYDSTHLVAGDPTKRVWIGSNMRFRVDGGVFTVSIYGAGIDLNAVGLTPSGKIWLEGSATVANDGRYSIDGGDFKSLPDVGGWLPIGG